MHLMHSEEVIVGVLSLGAPKFNYEACFIVRLSPALFMLQRDCMHLGLIAFVQIGNVILLFLPCQLHLIKYAPLAWS